MKLLTYREICLHPGIYGRSGWFVDGCVMTNGSDWNPCCRVKRVILGARARIIDCSSKLCFGLHARGSPWRDLPAEFGFCNSVYMRFARWSNRGIWQNVFAELAKDADFEEVFLDSTIVRAHQHSSGAAKKKALKRSGARAED